MWEAIVIPSAYLTNSSAWQGRRTRRIRKEVERASGLCDREYLWWGDFSMRFEWREQAALRPFEFTMHHMSTHCWVLTLGLSQGLPEPMCCLLPSPPPSPVSVVKAPQSSAFCINSSPICVAFCYPENTFPQGRHLKHRQGAVSAHTRTTKPWDFLPGKPIYLPKRSSEG